MTNQKMIEHLERLFASHCKRAAFWSGDQSDISKAMYVCQLEAAEILKEEIEILKLSLID